jgi:integrase
MARQLDHSLDMFFKVYTKWIDGQHDEIEMAKIEAALRGEHVAGACRKSTADSLFLAEQ